MTDLKPVSKKRKLSSSDIGSWVTYSNGFKKERGKIKSFCNEMQTAFVVYHCDNNWNSDFWQDYTAACTNYSDLTFS